jgi:hypothetical protein
MNQKVKICKIKNREYKIKYTRYGYNISVKYKDNIIMNYFFHRNIESYEYLGDNENSYLALIHDYATNTINMWDKKK